MHAKILVVAAFVFLGAGCPETADPDPPAADGASGGKADDAGEVDTRGYAFVMDDEAFDVRRDHAGAPLLATIWGRIGEYSVEAPFVERHAYNDSPESSGLPWLLHITERFRTVHKSWAPSFEEMGLDTCDVLGLSDDALFDEDGFNPGALEPEQCFGQKILWPDPNTGDPGRFRRTIEVALPDYLTIELDEPAAFPNGRVPHEQINSLMFALAFLDHGGECTDEDGVVRECDLHTLWKRSDFLKPVNDVPFAGAEGIGTPATLFPYLGRAHRMDE